MREGWKETTLGERIRPTKGVTYASSDYCSHQDGHAFMTIKCVGKGGGFSAEGLKYYKGAYLEEQVLHAGDLVIALTDLTRAGDIVGGPVLVPNFGAGATVLPSMDLAILRPTSVESNLTFLFYRLMLPDARRYMLAYAGGTTVLHLTTKAVRKFEYLAPPPSDQTKIAEILSTVDEAIEHTEALIAKTQQIKAGLMHDLFTRGVTPDGQLRPPREEAPQLYKESPLGWIPREWDCEILDDLLANVACPIRSGPFGSGLLKEELVKNGIPLLGIDNVFAERFVSGYRRFVTPQKFVELNRYAVFPRDLMITIMGTVGRCCVVPQGIGEALSSKHLWTMTFDHNRVLPELICWQLNYAPWVNTWFAQQSQGAVMDAIRSTTLRTLKLPVPPINEQLLIRDRYAVCERVLSAERERFGKLNHLKSGLMHDLLTGRVRVATETSAKPAPATANV